MNKVNYQLELDKIIDSITADGITPTLLMHSCCAPCSSYCLNYLAEYFSITVLYYNPNISPKEEYDKRVQEQIRLIGELSLKNKVRFIEGNYEPERFYQMAEGMEHLPEGGERCFRCYELRLREAAEYAARLKMDYFTTTLSISPLKNAEKLNEIGERLAKEYGISYLCSDFKKKNGYKRSVELSREYGMYRQDYCGCVFSKQERESQKSHDKSR